MTIAIFGNTLRQETIREVKHIIEFLKQHEVNIVLSQELRHDATNEKDFGTYGGNVEGAKKLGEVIAERALKAGIENVVFDRGGYLYHGRVKALAEGAREGGLKF